MSFQLTTLYGAVDHTYLKTLEHGVDLDSQKKRAEQLVQEVHANKAYGICVYDHLVSHIRSFKDYKSTPCKISVVTGFPYIDVSSVQRSVQQVQKWIPVVDEVDMVLDYKSLMKGDIGVVKDHVKRVSDVVGLKTLKVIFENCYLSEKQIKSACLVLNQVFEDLDLNNVCRMAKTSTGFASMSKSKMTGAVLEDVRCMRRELEPNIGIKVAGGIKDLSHANDFFEACLSPMKKSAVDTKLFRIGSSSLLPSNLKENSY